MLPRRSLFLSAAIIPFHNLMPISTEARKRYLTLYDFLGSGWDFVSRVDWPLDWSSNFGRTYGSADYQDDTFTVTIRHPTELSTNSFSFSGIYRRAPIMFEPNLAHPGFRRLQHYL